MRFSIIIALIFITTTPAYAAEEKYECVVSAIRSGAEECKEYRGRVHMCQIYDSSFDGTNTPTFCNESCLKRSKIPEACASVSVRPTTNPEAHENRTSLKNPLPHIQDMVTHWSKMHILCSEKPRYVQKGTITNLGGKKQAWIERGMSYFRAAPHAPLMGGDRLAVKEDTTVTIDLRNTGALTVGGGTKFLIPLRIQDIENQCLRGALQNKLDNTIGGTWHWIKQAIQGEKYEIKYPTTIVGVRG